MHGYGVEGEHNCADLDPFVAPMHPSPNLHYMDCKYVSAWELGKWVSIHIYVGRDSYMNCNLRTYNRLDNNKLAYNNIYCI